MQPRSTFGGRLRALRLARGLSQVELARLIGRHQTAIGPYERDEYEPPREVVERLAALLETSPEYLYFGRSPQRSTIAVIGRIGAAGLIEPTEAPTLRLIGLRDEHLRGYQLLDDSMAPVFRAGQLVLIAAAAGDDPARYLGQDVLAELADGRVMLRRLMPSGDPRRYDLVAYNAPPLSAVVVQAAWLIAGVLWPVAWELPDAAQLAKPAPLAVDEKFS